MWLLLPEVVSPKEQPIKINRHVWRYFNPYNQTNLLDMRFKEYNGAV